MDVQIEKVKELARVGVTAVATKAKEVLYIYIYSYILSNI